MHFPVTVQSVATSLPNAAGVLRGRRDHLVEKAPIVGALFDALVAAMSSGVTPALREDIRRIARGEARPLSEYRVAQRTIFEALRAEAALDEYSEDVIVEVIHEAIAAGSACAEIRELTDERELRDRVVSALAHDLRTPLSSMRVGADVLATSTPDPLRVQQIAARIRRNVDRADHMIRDMLDANALRDGRTLPIERSLCNVVKIAQDTIDELTTIHGNRFVLRASSVAIEGSWDGSAVRRILENLCGNAAKYGRPASTITVSLIATDRDVQLEVHNDGAPIDPAAQQQLFVVFQRGIGLALVRGLAEAHGGSVSVTSTSEAGTTFRVVLLR